MLSDLTPDVDSAPTTEDSRSSAESTSQSAHDWEARLQEARQNTLAVIQVIEAVGHAATTRQVQTAVLEAVCRSLDLQYGACWMIDRNIQATSFAAEYGNLGPEYDKVNQNDHYKYGQGLGGRTWKARDLIFIQDMGVIKDSHLVRTAQAAGAQSSISFPFIVKGEVEGVLMFFGFQILHPSEDRLNALRKIGLLVGQAFGRLEELELEKAQQQQLHERAGQILEVVEGALAGDLTRPVTVDGEDAVGQIASGLRGFLGKLREEIRGIALDSKLLGGSMQKLGALSKTMTANAAQTSGQATQATSASQKVSNSIDAVADGATEMLSSIQEISHSAQDSARVTREAVQAAEVCTAVVAKLGESSREINKVVKVISSVAQQTNLLALNATIEAARAGEAGKGFAVVANEVKELAKETARATEDIGHKIEAIQTDTKTAIRAIEDINSLIGQVDAASSQIAAAVEQQSATTKEIGRNVGEAAREAGAIAQNIAQVATTAETTAQGATETESAAQALRELTVQLDSLVARFKVD